MPCIVELAMHIPEIVPSPDRIDDAFQPFIVELEEPGAGSIVSDRMRIERGLNVTGRLLPR